MDQVYFVHRAPSLNVAVIDLGAIATVNSCVKTSIKRNTYPSIYSKWVICCKHHHKDKNKCNAITGQTISPFGVIDNKKTFEKNMDENTFQTINPSVLRVLFWGIQTGVGRVYCHNARGRVRRGSLYPDPVGPGMRRAVCTSQNALQQQIPTDVP